MRKLIQKKTENNEKNNNRNHIKGYRYSLDLIVYTIRVVVFGLVSLRGSTRVLGLGKEWLKGVAPSHVTIQSWVLRYGLHQLQKPPEKREDWIYIADHTINFGSKQCFVVLGVTVDTLLKNDFSIGHQDVHVLATEIQEKSDAASVQETFNKVSERTGIPVQIVSDGGSNIRRGAADFIESQKKFKSILMTYDVTHKAALILKSHLEKDDMWKGFTNNITTTKKCILHTVIGYMSPPKPKDKSRWLNLDMFVKWAENIIEAGEYEFSDLEREKYDSKLTWLREYEEKIKEWRKMLDLIDILKKEVKSNGLHKGTVKNFLNRAKEVDVDIKKLKIMKQDIVKYLQKETAQMKKGEKWLGCSDIIESVIGKYKNFSAKTPMKEVGKAVLTMPIYTSKVTPEEVRTALENVSLKDVETWMQTNIGQSFFSRRKWLYSLRKQKCNEKTNQKAA